MVKIQWYIIYCKSKIGQAMCGCHYRYCRYNQLNTSCKRQYVCDDLGTSDRFLVHQILHNPALKGHGHVLIETTS